MPDPALDVLFCYACTSEPAMIGRLSRSIAAQNSLASQWPHGRKALLFDASPEGLPAEVQRYFGRDVHIVPAHSHDGAGKRWFNLAKMRNASIDLALSLGVEWLSLCDADTVIISWAPVPAHMHRCRPCVYWQKSPDETLTASLAEIERTGGAAFTPANSWYVIHRSVFERFRFNEEIFGYGFEDVEFNDRLKWAGYGIPEFIPGAVVVHIFHAERNIDPVRSEANKAIYDQVAHPTSIA